MQFVVGDFKVDIENRKFWMYTGGSFIEDPWEILRRDPDAENEGFTFIRDLSDADVAEFFRQSDKYGFASWEDNYVDHTLADGHQWSVKIIFSDGSVKKIFGSNAYPDAYGDMREAFKALTGEDVLLA
jgi:hypothetical protein